MPNTTTTPYRGPGDELMVPSRALDLYRAAGDELLAAQRALSRALSATSGLSFDAKAKCYRRVDVAYRVYGLTEARVVKHGLSMRGAGAREKSSMKGEGDEG